MCCSAGRVRLIEVAARLAEPMLILSFPRDRFVVRIFADVVSGIQRVLGRSFRVFLHPPQSTRWFPSSNRSPRWIVVSRGAGIASGSVSPFFFAPSPCVKVFHSAGVQFVRTDGARSA